MENALNIGIIGGGLLGLSTADSLVHRGAKVTIFERRKDVGHGAGRYNSGMIHPSQAAPWFFDDPDMELTRKVFKWARNSRDLLMKRREMLGCEDMDRAGGTVQLFDSESIGKNARDFYWDLGVECQEYKGDWSFGYFGLEFLADQSGDAFHYCQKLAEDLKRRGCNVQTRSNAEIICQDGRHFIKTDDGPQHFDRIIVTAGAASTDILRSLQCDLPVSGLRGHALVFGLPDCPLPDQPIMHWASRSALTLSLIHI